nr:bidirectional sugar transporter SWEET5-like [Coffea arabica]
MSMNNLKIQKKMKHFSKKWNPHVARRKLGRDAASRMPERITHKELARTIIGVIGNVISFGMFVSPTPTFVNIGRAKSVQHFKPDPYLATTLNCAMWVFYGLPIVKKDSILVSTINGVGLVIEAIFVTLFFIYSNCNRSLFVSVLYTILNAGIFNPWLVIPNGLGTLGGLIQLIQYATYYGSTN